ncbi:folylpolyglutamate synthase/dihydrofolate synthase family protein [Candidatus Mesenet endosymbiont of Agriotes lineatus]|uniref:bifunctional folylpolyglutamate synthase/dihydrofolate synthase n=1 Tax=Candidatus Mesenet endosymbiont of Agriotes lineatus TaxID=3077948 RepID=UPI0030CF7295
MVRMPHWPKPLGFRPQDFDLDRIFKLLDRLGNPEKKLPPVIHVAGTNGKGSTIAFIGHIMEAAGYKVHTYTSPHLINFNERITLTGKHIADRELYSILEECRIAAEGIAITFFEGTTAAAFLVFSRIKADILLVEVGMGGRLDATNVIDNPLLTIITSISLEHTEYLGSTVEIIAGEKAGIIKPNVTCVIAPQQDSVMRILEFYVSKNKSPLYRGEYEWICKQHDSHSILFQSSAQSLHLPLPSLQGAHQITNAGNAIAACSILSGKYNYNIDYEHIASGIKKTYWPARLEHIKSGQLIDMLPTDWKLFIDGAHNPAGAQILSEWIANNFKKGVYIILGVTKDKDIEEFLKHIKIHTRLLCTVCVKSEPRSQNAKFVEEKAVAAGINAIACDSLSNAISKILNEAACSEAETIIVCGSLFLAADFMLEN